MMKETNTGTGEPGADIMAPVEETVSRERFLEVSAKLEETLKALKLREEQLEALKKEAGDGERMRGRIAELEREAEEAGKAHEAEIRAIRISHDADRALERAGAKNKDAVRALMADFLKDARITDDGRVEGMSEMVARLKESADTAFLFGEALAPRGFVPAEGREETDAVTLELLRKMTPGERHRFSVENPKRYKELYGGDI